MERHFHPLAKSICSNETEENFGFIFSSINKQLKVFLILTIGQIHSWQMLHKLSPTVIACAALVHLLMRAFEYQSMGLKI